MTHRIIGILILALLPCTSAAQSVLVRSGEHGAFTRLVLDVPGPLEWRLNRDGRQIEIKLADLNRKFDVSQVFTRITRDRVASIGNANTPGALRVALGCDCEVSVFRVSNRMIAIDISPTDEAIAGNISAEAGADARLATNSREPRLSFGLQDPVTLPPLLQPALTKEESVAVTQIADTSSQLPELPIVLPQETAPDLFRQIGRAASQGLLSQRRNLPDPNTLPPIRVDVPKLKPPLPTRNTLDEDLPRNVNLRAVTSIDVGTADLLRSVISDPSDPKCIPDSDLNIRDWSESDARFTTVIGTLRAELIGEFDRMDRGVALKLAKAYLYYGFGAEAAQVLEMLDLSQTPLYSLATAVDGISGTPLYHFSGMEPCQTAAALWAFLGPEAAHGGTDLNRASVQRNFDALPFPLRVHLGPKLARRLLAAGHEDLSQTILRRTERGVEEPDEHLKLADAELKLVAGKTTEGVELLAEIVREDGEKSPEALIAMVEQKYLVGESVPEDLANQIMVLSQENRGTEQFPSLKRAEVLARALATDFDTAFSVLETVKGDMSAPDWEATYRDVFQLIVREGSETDILTQSLLVPEGIKNALPPETANAVAGQLLASGFPSEAESYLNPGASGGLGRDRRILRARIALATQRPRRAEADLLGLDGKDVDRLRADARFMAGDYETATGLYLTIGEDELAAKSAWQAGQWDVARGSSIPELSTAAVLAARPESPQNETNTDIDEAILARNRALIEDSSSSRKILDELLARAQVQSVTATPEN